MKKSSKVSEFLQEIPVSSKEESKEIISLLRKNWVQFETVIHSISDVAGFSEFCAAYRGSVVSGHPGVSVLIREQKVQLIVRFFQDFLNQIVIEVELDDETLLIVERAVNTALYYAYFEGDRNFQFRTFIHFLQIDSFEFLVQIGVEKVQITVNEYGFSFSKAGRFSPFPERFSIAKVLGLNNYDSGAKRSLLDDKVVFDKVRVLQREFCLLIDEWEHLNSILAVEQFALRKLQSSEPEEVSVKMNSISQMRNGLAFWCVQSTADFQTFLSQLKSAGRLSDDLRAEISALDSLILSGVQKYLLPASVSRHVYAEYVLVEFLRWVRARMEHEPDDLYLHFAEATFSLATGKAIPNLNISKILVSRSSDWVLSADPSAVIKAVAWVLSPLEHRFFTAALTVALDCKTAPQSLDSYWLHTIASVIEMPGTFPREQKTHLSAEFSKDGIESLIPRALNAVENAMCINEEELQQTIRYIKEFLRSELEVREREDVDK
ncbi:MAG: hypothetical protein RJB13_371 [Pseudomonadota bacterium]